ncbi:metallophosphoesterase family protein [Leptolyngbya ohadii]|uniref:metallophosphoesterase family protein n=1 Tax=Leptolyngbya ohadii TaxID=1962290 RepID=UPI0021F0DC66|nr:metallophosphoesterase [Leptolyngbya ohadii]
MWDSPHRFHLVEVSIPAIEQALDHLTQLDLDFLLLPGDLTQHGEPENHAWLADRLSCLPFPAYVIPGNHDIPHAFATDKSIGLKEFPHYYQKFGYSNPDQPYYTCEILPGVRLIGLNSNTFNAEGQQGHTGYLDPEQMAWLQQVLSEATGEVILVMVHHNVLEHLPRQSQNPMGQRYMLSNAPELLTLLRQANAQLLFTGHLHVQDIAQQGNLSEITTGSLVSYPHPYRVLEYRQEQQATTLQIESHHITDVPDFPNLSHHSREWMGDRSRSFMLKLLTQPPLNLPLETAEQYAPSLRYFWADIAKGDSQFYFPEFPPQLNQYFAQFGAITPSGNCEATVPNGAGKPIDNQAVLTLKDLEE